MRSVLVGGVVLDGEFLGIGVALRGRALRCARRRDSGHADGS